MERLALAIALFGVWFFDADRGCVRGASVCLAFKLYLEILWRKWTSITERFKHTSILHAEQVEEGS